MITSGWKAIVVFNIIVAIIVLCAFKWCSEPEQWHSGDPNYNEIIAKDRKHKQELKGFEDGQGYGM